MMCSEPVPLPYCILGTPDSSEVSGQKVTIQVTRAMICGTQAQVTRAMIYATQARGSSNFLSTLYLFPRLFLDLVS